MNKILVPVILIFCVTACTALGLSLRRVDSIAVNKTNDREYGISVDVSFVTSPYDFPNRATVNPKLLMRRVSITVPQEVAGNSLERIGLYISNNRDQKLSILAPLELRHEAKSVIATANLNLEALKIAVVSVDYKSANFVYLIDLGSYENTEVDKGR